MCYGEMLDIYDKRNSYNFLCNKAGMGHTLDCGMRYVKDQLFALRIRYYLGVFGVPSFYHPNNIWWNQLKGILLILLKKS